MRIPDDKSKIERSISAEKGEGSIGGKQSVCEKTCAECEKWEDALRIA